MSAGERQAVAVKPLVWEPGDHHCEYATGLDGTWTVGPDGPRSATFGYVAPWGRSSSRGHASIEDAKAAAQADYERRILSALVEPRADRDPLFELAVEVSTKLVGSYDAKRGVYALSELYEAREKAGSLLAKLEASNGR